MDATPIYLAPRTCTTVDDGEASRGPSRRTAPLSDYTDAAAYVLIAEPGAGKTTAFRTEAHRQGAVFVTVRRFLTYDDRPEWRDTTLFLDGLDESRAGTWDGRTPLDDICNKLDRLGRLRFRLSCRWADWMAANDKEALKDVAADGAVTVIRLDPLSKSDIKAILANTHDVEDPDRFVRAARKQGVDRLLENPQNLDLLAKAVSGGAWPDSRKETFDLACRMLVGESNGEHLAGNPRTADTGPLIDAAGRLCAAQLLSGVAGFTLPDRAEPDADYPSFTEVTGDARGSAARNVLGTRLFAGASEGKLAPAHRQIAEFLAARHVSALIDGGLPLQRVLALITGFGGELVPSFMNFASWLAVHNKRSRKLLGRLYASGLIYAGDAHTYSADEKRDLVRNLRRESNWNPWCSRNVSKLPGIGAIVSPEVEGTFREILTDAKRRHEHQSYVMLLLQMLADGEPLPALADVLEQTVRDRTWNQGVRCAALDVLTGYHARGRFGPVDLKRMVAEIEEGSLDDPQDELLGILLQALYPQVLSTAEVLRHLREPKAEVGEYVDFWARHVLKESTPEQSADLLDAITARFDDYRPFLAGEPGRLSGLGHLPMELLTRVFREIRRTESGTGVAVDRLYRWLGVVSDPDLALTDWQAASLEFDLQWDQDLLKALIDHGVETCPGSGAECTDVVSRPLFGARPLEYGPWCLQKAIAANEGKAASFYLRELCDCVMDDEGRGERLTADAARAGLAQHEALLNQFDELVERRTRGEPQPDRQTAPESLEDTEAPEDTPEQRIWQAHIEEQAPALRAGRGAPQLLNRAAEAYLGIQESSAGKTPRERIGDLVGSRTDLIDLLVAAMERTIAREDLPSCDDVVRLLDRNRISWLVLPFVAGLHLLEQAGRLSPADLDERQSHLAVTILYLLPPKWLNPNSDDESGTCRPAWFRTLLRDNPALVADVLRRSAARKLETGVQPAIELRELADAEDHREVAALAALPILGTFPKAETDTALMALCCSLNAALSSCDWSDVGNVIEERLGKAHLAPAEHVCWVMAGFLVEPERYREEFQAVTADESCLEWLSRFVAVGFRTEFARRLTPRNVAALVVAMGAALRRDGLPERAYWSTSEVIGTLGDDPSGAATETLEVLGTMAAAQPWFPAVTGARERQATKRREHEYGHSDVGQVVEMLDNRAPANAGDLAALVSDELEHLSRRIRDGSTSDWRQYWNVNRHSQPTNPKPEESCRDAVLSDLRERLGQLGIDAQPEGVYADDKKSDIRVSFAGFNVPVEIKRSCHRELWTAVRSQLIARYTRDHEAFGHGIYLVFWFGATEKCRPTKCAGWTPETAEDVRVKIEQSLDEREGRLISVCVVDVSEPHRPS